MAGTRPRDLLSDGLLAALGRPGALAADIARLAEAGYLNVAVPPEFGGGALGCTLRQAACGQRRLARHAPGTALAVSAHLYWTGAAADACRAGDGSVRWLLAEAARGALVAGGHGDPGADLKLADPGSRCDPDGSGGYLFRDPAVLSTVTPSWDWAAVHAVHAPAGLAGPRQVIAFAGRPAGSGPAFRVARVTGTGTPADVFTTSALTWGHAILASVQYAAARRALDDAISACAQAVTPDALTAPGAPAARGARPAGRWPVAEASARLDAMKVAVAEVTHPWQLFRGTAPDPGGQHLIGLHAMRHEVDEGAASVYALVERLTGVPAPDRPLAR